MLPGGAGRQVGGDGLVADHYGEMVVAPFEFALTETRFAVLAASIARAEAARSAEIVRVGVESVGHYHRTLVARHTKLLVFISSGSGFPGWQVWWGQRPRQLGVEPHEAGGR